MKLSRTGPGHLHLPFPWLQLLTVRIYLLQHPFSFFDEECVLSHLSCSVHVFLYDGIYRRPEQQLLCHVLKMSLPGSQRQQAAASPLISISWHAFIHCAAATLRRYRYIKALTTSDYTTQNLENRRKNSKHQNLSSLWDTQRWRPCLTDGTHNFQVQENSGSEKPLTPSSLSLELYVRETPGIVWYQRHHWS